MVTRSITAAFFTIFTSLLLAVTAAADSAIPVPPNVRVTNIPQLNNEEQVVICPTDSSVVIANWRDFRLGFRQIGIGRSTDGGATWADSLLSRDMQYFGYSSWQSDPTLTVDRFGNYIMSVLDFIPGDNTSNSVIAFYRTTDQGISWSGPFVPSPSGNWFEDKQFITVDRTGGPHDGNLYCAWARFPNPTRIMLVKSADGGLTWGDTTIVGPVQSSSACGSGTDAGQFAIPIVTANGNLHIFWMGARLDSGATCTGSTYIKHRTSSDGGQTFGLEQAVSPATGYMYASGGINTYSAPAGDADISSGPFRGNLYLAFATVGPEDSTGRSDVDFMTSTDNGVTWSPRMKVNDDANSGLNDHFHPWVTCNEDGIVALVFYDQRYDPSHHSYDLSAAYSFDGGQTISTNHRVSSVSSSPDFARPVFDPGWSNDGPMQLNPSGTAMMRPMAGKLGEYIGISAFHDKMNAVWTDTRDGNQEVYSSTWKLPLLEPRLSAPPLNSYQPATQTYRWSTSWKSSDDRYRLEVSASAGFATLAWSQLLDTNFLVSGMSLPDGNYFWRVKTFKISTGDSSAYSPVWSFTVDTQAPSVPVLLSPANNAVTKDSTPVFSWSTSTFKRNSPDGTAGYDLQVSSDSGFPSTAATRSYTGLTVTTYEPADKLVNRQLYFWRVRAFDQSFNYSLYSAPFKITYNNSCCIGKRGDINLDGNVNLGDLSFIVCILVVGANCTPTCMAEADVNANGTVNLADLSALVNYLTGGGYVLLNCP